MELCAVGGWGEVGRNMTAVRSGDFAVVFDMGLHLPNYINLTENSDNRTRFSEHALKAGDVIPHDKVISDWRADVRAIVVSHAHLDHAGAVPWMSNKYDAPIICTPFTAAVLRSIVRDERIALRNRIVELKPGKTMRLAKNFKLEFVHITHSTPQTVMVALHTPEGVVLYGDDYKLDDHPVLGKPPDYDRLKELGRLGVHVLIQDCLYAVKDRHTPDESVAQELLWEVMERCDPKRAIVVTTFASHIARLRAVGEYGKKLGRKVLFMSRSLSRYGWAAKDAGITDLERYGRIFKFARQIRAQLRKVQAQGKEKFVLVVSGHQGEPKSTLSKMIDGVYDWRFDPGDAVIFSSTVIPAEINKKNREEMDLKLRDRHVRIFKDVHVSGHSSGWDLRRILQLTRPSHVFPTHGEFDGVDAFAKIAESEGYRVGLNLHVLNDGDRIVTRVE